MSSRSSRPTAEQCFRLAFERLKANTPRVVPPDTPVSQNNVAKEAGCDPSALRKERYPSLVREIKAYLEIAENQRPSKRKERLKLRKRRVALTERLKKVEEQRDAAQSQLVSAQRRVIELALELKAAKDQLEELRPSLLGLSR